MVKYLIIFSILFTMTAYADDTTAQQLDDLEKQRVLLSKQLEVTKLQQQLNAASPPPPPPPPPAAPPSPAAPAQDLALSALQLIKIVGMSSKPKAVFLYNGYRITGEKGQIILPKIQLKDVTESHVSLKDMVSGKETVVWLSPNNSGGGGSGNGNSGG